MNWYQKNISLVKMSKRIRKKIVDSDVIGSISYDVDTKTLAIKFRRGGSYAYSNVPKRVFENFMRARSKGKFFNDSIRNQYSIAL